MVVDITGEPEVIAEVSFPTALTTLHEKAIYLHEARQYHVERFDYDERKAYVRRVECDYYTDAIDYTQVKVLQEFEKPRIWRGASSACTAMCASTARSWVSRRSSSTRMENVGAGNLSMPEQEMHTTASGCIFPPPFWRSLTDLYANRETERAGRSRQRAADRGRAAADVRSARSGRRYGTSRGQRPSNRISISTTTIPAASARARRSMNWRRRWRDTAELIAAARAAIGCPSCVGPVGEVGERGKARRDANFAATVSGMS